MMKLIPAVLLITEACQRHTEPLPDNLIHELRLEMPGIAEQCIEKVRYGGILAMPEETDQCFEMSAERRWKGLWRIGFEISRFCPAPNTACSNHPDGDLVWLSGKTLRSPGNKEGLYTIEFEGRITAHQGRHGHMGAYEHEIVVDRIIALRPVLAEPNSMR